MLLSDQKKIFMQYSNKTFKLLYLKNEFKKNNTFDLKVLAPIK